MIDLMKQMIDLQYNTSWVLQPVNKMTNVFFDYNHNYIVTLMTA